MDKIVNPEMIARPSNKACLGFLQIFHGETKL